MFEMIRAFLAGERPSAGSTPGSAGPSPGDTRDPAVPGGSRPSDTREAPVPLGTHDPLHVAACALLLEVAFADGEFSAAERKHLEAVLERHFSLPAETGRELISIAETEHKGSIDHFRFTSLLAREYDLGQKMLLAEVLWGIVLSDGKVAEHEHYLARKIGNLLGLEPGYLSAARTRAMNADSLEARTQAMNTEPPDSV